MRRGICGFYLIDLGLLSNFKSVRIDILLENFFFFFRKAKKIHGRFLSVSKIRSGPFLVSRTGDEGFNLTLSR